MSRIRKGTNGNDVLHAGRDGQSAVWFGRRGDDDIAGGSGRDIIFGGRGDDTLCGGVDNNLDVLVGGRGGDTFQFSDFTESPSGRIGHTNRDVIADFSRKQGDKIDLTLLSGGSFIDSSAFSAAGHAEVQDRNGVLRIDRDGDGDVDFRIKVGADLSASDLLL